jgi:hypothetical protein
VQCHMMRQRDKNTNWEDDDFPNVCATLHGVPQPGDARVYNYETKATTTASATGSFPVVLGAWGGGR